MTDPTDFTLSPVSMNNLSIDTAENYAVNFPIEDAEDGEEPRTVRGTGSTMREAFTEAKEKAARRRQELGLVDTIEE